jgi:hypothetical protein
MLYKLFRRNNTVKYVKEDTVREDATLWSQLMNYNIRDTSLRLRNSSKASQMLRIT